MEGFVYACIVNNRYSLVDNTEQNIDGFWFLKQFLNSFIVYLYDRQNRKLLKVILKQQKNYYLSYL